MNDADACDIKVTFDLLWTKLVYLMLGFKLAWGLISKNCCDDVYDNGARYNHIEVMLSEQAYNTVKIIIIMIAIVVVAPLFL